MMTFLLTACSTAVFKDSDLEQAVIENRRNKNDSNVKSSILINKDENIDIQTTKTTSNRIDPNIIFENYSIYFDLDEYSVQEKFLPVIKKHAEFLVKNPSEFVFVEGHTDERGGLEYNLALGQKRSFSVKTWLIRYGVREDQIEAYSYGATKPRALGNDEEAWSQNRRVDLQYRN